MHNLITQKFLIYKFIIKNKTIKIKIIKKNVFFLNSRTCKSDSGLRSFSTNYRPPRGSDKIRAASGPSILPRSEDVINAEQEVNLFLFF